MKDDLDDAENVTCLSSLRIALRSRYDVYSIEIEVRRDGKGSLLYKLTSLPMMSKVQICHTCLDSSLAAYF